MNDLGLSISELARILEMDRKRINNYLIHSFNKFDNSKGKYISQLEIFRITKYLGINVKLTIDIGIPADNA